MSTTLRIYPEIRTALPGPKVQALIEKDARYLSPSYTRGYPLAIAKGDGAMIEDHDGNRFLDFCAGIAVCSTGHSHPAVVDTVKAQAEQFLHMSGTDFYYTVMADLAERLAQGVPGENRVFFGNSGAEANEGAIKLARYSTGREKIIAFYRSFHGRTMGALSLGASKVVQRRKFSPMLPGVFHAHYPYPYRDLFGTDTPEACADRCLDYIKNVLFKYTVPPEEVAAFILEPIQGEGGYIVPPARFLHGLRELADQHGILIIMDEVQAGIGRTGKLWAYEHFDGFVPDMVTSAKGLASGLPLGAVIARKHLMQWQPGAHASTFGGNPVSCAAALTTLDLVENGLMQNAAKQGETLMAALRALDSPVIGDVRGLGLMVGVEIVKDKTTREPNPDLRNALVDACFYQGLLVLGCGESTIRLCPPLVICEEQVHKAVDILAHCLASLGHA